MILYLHFKRQPRVQSCSDSSSDWFVFVYFDWWWIVPVNIPQKCTNIVQPLKCRSSLFYILLNWEFFGVTKQNNSRHRADFEYCVLVLDVVSRRWKRERICEDTIINLARSRRDGCSDECFLLWRHEVTGGWTEVETSVRTSHQQENERVSHFNTTKLFRQSGQTARHPPSINISELSVTFLHDVWTHVTLAEETLHNMYRRRWSRRSEGCRAASVEPALGVWWQLYENMLEEQLARSSTAEASPLPALVSAENTPLPSEGIYPVARRRRRGRRVINSASHARISADDWMKIFHSGCRQSKDIIL